MKYRRSSKMELRNGYLAYIVHHYHKVIAMKCCLVTTE